MSPSARQPAVRRPTRGAPLARLTLLGALSVLGASCAPGQATTGPDAAVVPEHARPVQNLAAFARLYGYVRYFHPSDEATGIDWNRFAVLGAGRVRDAATPAELADALKELFLPIAPTLELEVGDPSRVAARETRRAVIRETPAPARQTGSQAEAAVLRATDTTSGARAAAAPAIAAPPAAGAARGEAGYDHVAWRHYGFRSDPWSFYSSTRVNRPGMIGGRELVRFLQPVPAAAQHAGKHVRLRAAVRTEVDAGRGHARLLLTSPGTSGPDASVERITAPDWREYEIRARIPRGQPLFIGGAVWGSGRAWFDVFELSVSEDGETWTSLPIMNPDFEFLMGENLAAWSLTSAPEPWLRFAPDRDGAFRGETAALLEVDQPDRLFEKVPDPREILDASLGRGLRIRLPLTLPSRDGRTQPPADPDALRRLETTLAAVDPAELTLDDERVRAADVVVGWSVLQHFFPYHDEISTDWNDVLGPALAAALAATSPEEHVRALQRMIAALEDGHGRVSHPAVPPRARLPIAVDWAEGQVVVTASRDPEQIRAGDVVVAVDGVPAPEILADAMALASGSEGWRRHVALRAFGEGPAGSEAALTLRRGEETLTRRVKREPGPAPAPAQLEPITELEGDVIYVDLRRAGMARIRPRLQELSRAAGVIFDVRGYPQADAFQVLFHLTDAPVRWFRGCVLETVYPDRHPAPGCAEVGNETYEPRTPRFQGRAVFLTNGSAISYAESVMGIVEHYRLGEIVGQPTAGANGNMTWITLPSGGQLYWTGMHVVKHDGSRHFAVGHRPTVPIERTIAGIREGRDESLEAALRLLRSEPARP